MQTLRICTIQSDLIWHEVDENLLQFEQKIIESQVDKPDLIVLPEMFTTGFTMQTDLINEQANEKIEAWFKSISRKTNALILGTTIYAHGNGDFTNRLIAAYPEGNTKYYDKQYLFAMGKEDQYFKAGSERLIIECKDWNILPLICYDLRFADAANHAGEADLILYTASWPGRRIAHWDILIQARAIENLSYVVAVNRVGEDGHGVSYPGHSQVVSPMGEILVKSINNEQVETVEINKKELEKVRRKLPFLKDKK